MPIATKITLAADDYKKELDAVVAKTRADMRTLQSAGSGEVKANTAQGGNGTEKIRQIKNDLKTLPKDVNVDVSKPVKHVGQLADAVKKTGKESEEMQRKMRASAEQMSKAGGAVGALTGALGTVNPQMSILGQLFSAVASGPIAIFSAAIAVAIAAVVSIWDKLTLSAEEYQAKLARLTADAEKHAQQVQKESDAARGYMSRLQSLAGQEVLSNEAKAEAARLIATLTSKYGDLGISINDVITKTGALDAAQEKLNRKLLDAQKAELRRQADAAQKQAAQEAKIAAGSGYGVSAYGPVGFVSRRLAQKGIQTALSGKTTDQQIQAVTKIRDQVNTEEESAAWQKVIDTLEKEKSLRQQIGEIDHGLSSRQLADTQAAVDKKNQELAAYQSILKAQARQQMYLDLEQKKEYRMLEIFKQIDALQDARNGKMPSPDEVDAIHESANATFDSRQRNAIGDKLQTVKDELTLQSLLASKRYEEYEALKLQLELKKQGFEATKAETAEYLKRTEAQKGLNLKSSLRDQGQSLVYSAMERAGMGQEAAYAKALDDAEKTKGAKLTNEESGMVKKLAELSWNLSTMPLASLGDLSIKTNSLTARGGFASGAVVQDKDEINRAIRSNTQKMAEQLKELQGWMDKINETIKQTGKV